MFMTERPEADRTHCPPDERLCGSGDQCISQLHYCDGIHHCWDHSDEIDCCRLIFCEGRLVTMFNTYTLLHEYTILHEKVVTL